MAVAEFGVTVGIAVTVSKAEFGVFVGPPGVTVRVAVAVKRAELGVLEGPTDVSVNIGMTVNNAGISVAVTVYDGICVGTVESINGHCGQVALYF